ncbi:hypothetical protein ACXR6G_02300 [Ancylomarina sp. YFZ004]
MKRHDQQKRKYRSYEENDMRRMWQTPKGNLIFAGIILVIVLIVEFAKYLNQ